MQIIPIKVRSSVCPRKKSEQSCQSLNINFGYTTSASVFHLLSWWSWCLFKHAWSNWTTYMGRVRCKHLYTGAACIALTLLLVFSSFLLAGPPGWGKHCLSQGLCPHFHLVPPTIKHILTALIIATKFRLLTCNKVAVPYTLAKICPSSLLLRTIRLLHGQGHVDAHPCRKKSLSMCSS